MNNPNNIQVGDTVYIEQAWEDTTGQYHDEYAEVKSIDEDGDMALEFDNLDVTMFLSGAEFNVKDYKPYKKP